MGAVALADALVVLRVVKAVDVAEEDAADVLAVVETDAGALERVSENVKDAKLPLILSYSEKTKLIFFIPYHFLFLNSLSSFSLKVY